MSDSDKPGSWSKGLVFVVLAAGSFAVWQTVGSLLPRERPRVLTPKEVESKLKEALSKDRLEYERMMQQHRPTPSDSSPANQ